MELSKRATPVPPAVPDDPEPSLLRRRESALALAVITTLLVVAYWNVVFAGKSLVHSDNYNPLHPAFTEANLGPDFEPADTWHRRNLILYPNFHDSGAVWWQWDPGGEFLRRALQRGEFPLWDPYVGGGAPAMANLTQAFFFPPHLLVVALGNTSTLRNVYYLVLLVASGFFTYLLLRRHGLTPIGSLAGAIGFMFSGGLTQHAGSFVGQTAACLPATLYLTRWFIDRPGWSRVAALAIGYAAVSLASFPPLLTQIFGLAAAYVVCMVWRGEIGRRRLRVLGYYAVAAGAALLTVAFYYLPAYLAFGSCDQAQGVYSNAALIGWALPSLYQLLSPVLMGGAPVFQAPLMPGMEYYYVPYVGIVLLWLSGLADSRGEGPRGPLFTFTLVAALAVALKIVGVAPIHWLGYLPGLASMHFAQYYGVGLSFLLAILAAIGTENLMARRVSRLRIVVLSVFLVTALCSLLQFAAERNVLQPRINRWLFEWVLLALLGLLAFGVTLAARRRAKRLPQWAIAVAALALLYAEGARNAYYPRQVRADVFRRPPRYVHVLKERGPWSRVFTLGPLPANTNSAMEIPSWDSLMAFNPPRSFALYRRYTGTAESLFLRGATVLPPEPVLDAVAIDVIIVRAADEAGVAAARARGHRELFTDDYVKLFERRGTPRCFFTSDFRVVRPAEGLELLSRPRPARQILIERAPAGFQAVANRAEDPPAALAAAGRNRWRVKVDVPRPGFLYCSEPWDAAGWAAKVNGRAVPIAAANHAFRAVRLNPGRNEVEFAYWPPGLTAGLWLSGLGAVTILCAGVFGRL